MNSLSELQKTITSLQDKIKPFNFNETISNGLKASNSIPGITQSISDQRSPLNKVNLIAAESNTFSAFANKRISAHLAAMESLSYKTKQSFKKTLNEIAKSQLLVTNNLNHIFNNSYDFSPLNNAILGISNIYLRDIASRKEWGRAEIVKEVNETIISATEDYSSDNDIATREDLEKLSTSLLNTFHELHLKSKSKSIKAYLGQIIQMLIIVFGLYMDFTTLNDISNKEVVDITKSEIQDLEKKLLTKMDNEFKKLNKTRIASTNVNLRKSCSKRAQIKGLVKTGQIVTVIEIRHKWLLVTYIDNETEEPFSGFVYKKYFKSK